MIKGSSQGGLLYPNQVVKDGVLICYLTIKKPSESDSFYRSLQRKLGVNTCLAVLDGKCMKNSGDANFCETHVYSKSVKIIVWASTKILLNNLCFKKKQ